MEPNVETNMDPHGTFPMVTSPHTLKGTQHGTQHGNQHGPPQYLSHGDLPHTLKAGNQHGTKAC